MARATLGSVRVDAIVPRGDPVGTQAAARLHRACDGPLPGAVAEAFGVLDHVDADAFWVIRNLHVHTAVPASEPDPRRQARRIADAMALAVERVVRAGPGPDAVRFTNRTVYAASFVQAQLAGAGGAWVYDRLTPLRPLAPVPAVGAVAAFLDVGVLDVVAALVVTAGWQQLIRRSTPADLVRLQATVRTAAGPPGHVPRGLLDSARVAREAAAVTLRRDPVLRRLDLLGRMFAAFGASATVVDAVWAAQPAPAAPGGRTAAAVAAAEVDDAVTRAALPTHREGVAPASISGAATPGRTSAFASAGAVAFLLLPDLADLIPAGHAMAGPEALAARVRADVLGAVLHTPVDDPAIALAAGVVPPPPPSGTGFAVTGLVEAQPDEAQPEGVPQDLADLAAVSDWRELLADPALRWEHPDDAQWFPAQPAVVRVLAVALLRAFARHLIGFGHASAAYLVERVLPPGGTVVDDPVAITVELPAPALQVVLQLAGLDAFVCTPSWLDRPVTVAHERSR